MSRAFPKNEPMLQGVFAPIFALSREGARGHGLPLYYIQFLEQVEHGAISELQSAWKAER